MSRPILPTLFCALSLTCQAFAAPSPALILLDDEAEPSCDLDFSLATGATGTFHVEFDRQSDTSFYALDGAANKATFSLVQNGKARVLSQAPVSWNKSSRVTIQRRPFGMSLFVDGEVALRAFDPTWTSGKIGTSTTGAWKIADARVQPVEAVRFDDDFTRAGDGGDLGWKTGSGKWVLSAASTQVSARNADMSANPFAYASDQSKEWAMASAGRKFWNDYDARVAVRSGSGGSIGIAANVADSKNYLAFTLDANANDKPGTRRLVLVRGGKETVLVQSTGGFAPRQWVELGIRTSPGYVEGILDGTPVLKAKTDAFGQGGVAILSKGAPALWDDVSVRSYDFLRAGFSPSGAWSGAGWKLIGEATVAEIPGATLSTGRPDWNGYRVLISTPWTATSSGAVVAGWKNAKNYALIRWAGSQTSLPFKSKIEAVQVVEGVEKVVASAPFESESATKRLELDADQGDFSLAFDGRARVAMPLLSSGKFGLRSTQKNTRFSDAVIFFPQPPDPPKVATKFVNDGFMLGWASSLGEWPATPDKDGLQFWNTAELFGGWTLDFPWRARWKGKMEAALFANRGEFNSGLTLRAEPTADGQSVDWTLAQDTKLLATAKSKVSDLAGADGEGANFTLAWNNGLLSLRSDKAVVLSVPLAPDLTKGNSIALRASGFRVRTGSLKLWSANRDDFTFADAPTDFYAPSGKWSVFSRWPCYGDWSFFGGTGRQPRLWTKRTYGGDIVAEYYAHPQMDLPKEPGYSHPGDLNVTLCGDGQNPASGYSFLVSGHDNTRTQIWRDGKLVADNTSDAAWFHDPINHNTTWHRSWVYVRAQAKRAVQNGQSGVLVSLTVNNEPLCQFFDSKPLDSWSKGGRTCFWTLDSTLMLARAKIEAQTLGARSTPANLRDTTPVSLSNHRVPQVFEVQPLVETDESTVEVKADTNSIRVENQIAGGSFAATLSDKPMSIKANTRLQFNWKASDDTKVDVYLRTGDNWHLVELNGNQRPDALAPSVGKMTRGQSKDGWTPLSFDIGSALKGAIKVDEIRIGAIHGDGYRWQGFDGNSVGAWYEVKGLELK